MDVGSPTYPVSARLSRRAPSQARFAPPVADARPADARPADARPFDTFYRDERDRIVAAVGLTIGNIDQAADATAEAMLKAHLRWDEVAHYANPAGWVYTVALNQARGWRRTIRRRRTTPGRIPDRGSEDPPPTPPHLVAAVASLPLDLRQVVVCRHLLDLSTNQTAQALGIAPGTVKSRLSRALGQLRATIEPDEPDAPGEPRPGVTT